MCARPQRFCLGCKELLFLKLQGCKHEIGINLKLFGRIFFFFNKHDRNIDERF